MDSAELERELERLHPDSWGWVLACCGRHRSLAEDALQSAYLRVVNGTARFDGRSSFKTWLFGVIRRTAMEEVRRQRAWDDRSGDVALAAALPDPTDAPDVRAERAESRETLLRALRTLSDRQREVLELVFYHEMTIEDAAAVMAISVGSARTHYDRGKKGLARALESMEER